MSVRDRTAGAVAFDPAIRCYLFHGADEAGSRALAASVETAIAPDVERVDIAPDKLRAEPALLADEAASRSLFGSARCIRVNGAGEECVAAIELLMGAEAAGDPVILVAGALRKDSKLVARLAAEPSAVVRVSHPPDEAALARLAATLGDAAGLRIDEELARRLADACAGDRAVMAREITKLADYADAAPDAPQRATDAMLDAVGAGAGEADIDALLDALFAGDVRRLDQALARAAQEGQDGVPLVRVVQRRLLAMVAARAEMDRGATARAAVDRAGRALFWRAKDSVARSLPKWSSVRLATALDRVADLERSLKSSRGAGRLAPDTLYHAMARSAGR